MPGFYLTQAARSDLKEIGLYTQQRWGKTQRDHYLGLLDACFQLLAREPRMGRTCDDIRMGYRKHGALSHVIFYREMPTGDIEIVRILHNRMDPSRHVPDT